MRKNKIGVDYFPYDLELCNKLYEIRVCGMPLSFYLLDLRKTDTFCHLTASLLAYFLEGSQRIEGEIPRIKGDDKSHSWVEKDGFVYDTTLGTVWKKEVYYASYEPYNIRTVSYEEISQVVSKYLQYNDNMNEMYIAWIRDIVINIAKCPYKKILLEHIDRLMKEKDLENKEIDEDLVSYYLEQMKALYRHIEEFKTVDNSEASIKVNTKKYPESSKKGN